MRSRIGVTMVLAVLGAALTCACSSSSGGQAAPEAGSNACTDTLVNVLSNTAAACPLGDTGPLSYDEAITSTCESLKMTKGDVAYGQCFEYLAFEVDVDSSGNNFSRCFYDVSTHQLVGVIFADGNMVTDHHTICTVRWSYSKDASTSRVLPDSVDALADTRRRFARTLRRAESRSRFCWRV